MEFSDNAPIYKQIIDYCHERVVSGRWEAESRIPSMRELSVELAVNSRTVLKAYDELCDAGIIYQKRGLGYFVAPDALERILRERRREFFEHVIPSVARQMNQLGISPEEVIESISRYL